MECFLSVIICTYNREKYLARSLECISSQDIGNDTFELLVVNNNSTDETGAICHRFGKEHQDVDFKYISEKNPGLSFARNTGIREAKGDLIIFLDDDAMAVSSYLGEIRSYFLENPGTLAGGGKIIPEYESEPPSWMTPYLLPVVAALDLGNVIRDFPKNKYPIGANMFFRKEVFDTYGTFKTDLGRKGTSLLGGEEKDMFGRIPGGKNKIVYLPGAIVRHIVPDKRLHNDYIDRMATGVGISEAIRIRQNNNSVAGMFYKELIKWGGSVVLFFLYLLKLQPAKGKMLIRFRFFVTRGMLTGK